MKRFLNIFFGLIVLGGMGYGIYYVSGQQQNVLIGSVSINMQYLGEDVFLRADSIENYLNRELGSLTEKRIADLNIKKLESLIAEDPYVAAVNVYTSINGQLVIDIVQRQPALRVSTYKASFYIDSKGYVIPINADYVSRVPFVNGMIKNYDYSDLKGINVLNIEGEDDLKKAFILATHIKKDKFLNALTEQIYVNRNKEFELVPKIGKQLILLGDVKNLDDKFRKLELFYSQGITLKGWDMYKLINLKYENQVVCTKRK